MAFEDCLACIDMQVFPTMAKQQVGFGFGFGFGRDHAAVPFPTEPVAPAAECVDERRFRRRISNRESARRSRARKQRRLGELRDSAAVLERGKRELAARAEASCGALALAWLANAELRAEAAALSRRLAAARRALVVLDRVYAGAAFDAGIGGGDCSLASLDIEPTIASLIA